jgi:hypothetical protein
VLRVTIDAGVSAMLRLLYYIFVWPFRLLIIGLVDDVLVLVGLKYTLPIGRPVWHRHPLRAALARWRHRRAARRDRARARVVR